MILPASINATGTVTFSANPPTSVVGCQGYEAGKPCGATGTNAADIFMGGFRYTNTGVLRTVDATAGNPAGTTIIGGFASSAGNLCTTTNAIDVNSRFLGGVAVNNVGAVHVV